MRGFYTLLGNSLVANITTFFVWSTLIYWAYLSTGSVLATSLISGSYLVLVLGSGFLFGAVVDHHKKKTAMMLSSASTLCFFLIALAVHALAPEAAFGSVASPWFWGVALAILLGVISGNLRYVSLPTAVTLLVPEDMRARANGMSGMVFGASFAVSNVAAGFGLSFLGMGWVLAVGAAFTALALAHLALVRIDEPHVVSTHGEEGQEGAEKKGRLDIKGTIAVMRSVPGLLPLIFFTTFNNFLGGVFMAIMDAYGLSLVSVQAWGTLWGFLSLAFIVGGLYISKKGVGKNPVRTLFLANVVIWTACIFMAAQPSIVLLSVAMFIYLAIVPFIEASEQTVIQKVVPKGRQGRVFGFAQSVEQAASPITAFMIGPIAQFFFIPFMTTGKGVDLIGSWYGTGPGRGLGLVFTIAGALGLAASLVAMRSRAARALAVRYKGEAEEAA